MAKIIALGEYSERTLVAFTAGETLKVGFICADVADVADWVSPDEGHATFVTFKKDALVLVSELSADLRYAKHLRFAREDRHLVGLTLASRNWPRIRRALKEMGIEPTHMPGGFCPVVYPDEIAIDNFSMSGSTGWIISKRLLRDILKANPMSEATKAKLVEDLKFAEQQYRDYTSDAKVRELAGMMLSEVWRPNSTWWTRVTVVMAEGIKTFGYNCMEEASGGSLSYYARGWGRTVNYRPIPEGASLVVEDTNYRWQDLFDGRSVFLHDVNANDDLYSQQVAHFFSAQVEYMGGEDGLQVLAVHGPLTYEQVLAELKKKDYVVGVLARAGQLRKTLQREGAL